MGYQRNQPNCIKCYKQSVANCFHIHILRVPIVHQALPLVKVFFSTFPANHPITIIMVAELVDAGKIIGIENNMRTENQDFTLLLHGEYRNKKSPLTLGRRRFNVNLLEIRSKDTSQIPKSKQQGGFFLCLLHRTLLHLAHASRR